MSENMDFSIKYGTLVKYQGPSGEVVIPKEVTAIGEGLLGLRDPHVHRHSRPGESH